MIIQQLFHTYKADFPLIAVLPEKKVIYPEGIDRGSLFKNLIIELSELTGEPKYCYMARHENDSVPNDKLKPFQIKFKTFLDAVRKRSNFGDCEPSLPTVWFVVYSEGKKSIGLIRQRLNEKQIEYFEETCGEHESIDTILPNNSETTNDEARAFPKFLHQTTQMGIDLLKTDAEGKLKELKSLESMQGPSLDSHISQLETHLKDYSIYYKESIEADPNERRRFWTNFKIVHGKHSWPHFLFNICGC